MYALRFIILHQVQTSVARLRVPVVVPLSVFYTDTCMTLSQCI